MPEAADPGRRRLRADIAKIATADEGRMPAARADGAMAEAANETTTSEKPGDDQMTTDEFAKTASALLVEGLALLCGHADDWPAIERHAKAVTAWRAQYRAAKEAPAPAPEPSAPPTGVPMCKAWCGRFAPEDMLSPCFHEPQGRSGRGLCCFCTNECALAGRPLNPPPSAPVTVATGGVPTGYRLGDGWRREGRRYVGAIGYVDADAPFGHITAAGAIVPIDTARPDSEDEPLPDDADLADALDDVAERARSVPPGLVPGWSIGTEGQVFTYESATRAASASEPGNWAEDMVARCRALGAEVDQLRGKLAEAVDSGAKWVERTMAARDKATARVRSMRDAAAKVARETRDDGWHIADAIERLPLDTGTAADAGGEAQADAIKAAVDKANNRAADAFREWWNALEGTPLRSMDGDQFEAWLRSGEDAPGAVGK